MSAVRMSNEMPGLEAFFHPVALSGEVCDGATHVSELLGRRWTLTRHRGVVHTVDDEAGGLVERYGLVWLAPDAPLADVIEYPEWDDSCFDAWYLECRRTPVSAALLIDSFVDAGTDDGLSFPFSLRTVVTHSDDHHDCTLTLLQPESDCSTRVYLGLASDAAHGDPAVLSEMSAGAGRALDARLVRQTAGASSPVYPAA